MSKPEEKQIYRIIAQKGGITVTAETSHEMTMEDATKTAIADVLGGVDKAINFQPYVALPITTEERWKAGYINFCPRCGANITDYELYEHADTDCFECDANLNISVNVYNADEDEE